MTVKELIEALSQFDNTLEVVLYHDETMLSTVKIDKVYREYTGVSVQKVILESFGEIV